jgi:hypothetical protein
VVPSTSGVDEGGHAVCQYSLSGHPPEEIGGMDAEWPKDMEVHSVRSVWWDAVMKPRGEGAFFPKNKPRVGGLDFSMRPDVTAGESGR